MARSIFQLLNYLDAGEYTQEDIDYLRATLRNLIDQGIIKIDIGRKYLAYIDEKEDELDS